MMSTNYYSIVGTPMPNVLLEKMYIIHLKHCTGNKKILT